MMRYSYYVFQDKIKTFIAKSKRRFYPKTRFQWYDNEWHNIDNMYKIEVFQCKGRGFFLIITHQRNNRDKDNRDADIEMITFQCSILLIDIL